MSSECTHPLASGPERAPMATSRSFLLQLHRDLGTPTYHGRESSLPCFLGLALYAAGFREGKVPFRCLQPCRTVFADISACGHRVR